MSTDRAPPVRQYPVVRDYMTPAPHSIARNRSLSVAGRMMRDNHVRHLPVLDGSRMVGVVSERDLLLVESLPGVNPTDARVEEAMVQDIFTVAPETPVADVIETMIDRKLGSAIVLENERLVGVFTTVDALRALRHLLKR